MRSRRPLVALLDAHLGDTVATQRLLKMAQAGGRRGRHAYLVLSTVPLARCAPRMAALTREGQIPVLQMPEETDLLVSMVAHAQGELYARGAADWARQSA
jgi:hypothetical protein